MGLDDFGASRSRDSRVEQEAVIPITPIYYGYKYGYEGGRFVDDVEKGGYTYISNRKLQDKELGQISPDYQYGKRLLEPLLEKREATDPAAREYVVIDPVGKRQNLVFMAKVCAPGTDGRHNLSTRNYVAASGQHPGDTFNSLVKSNLSFQTVIDGAPVTKTVISSAMIPHQIERKQVQDAPLDLQSSGMRHLNTFLTKEKANGLDMICEFDRTDFKDWETFCRAVSQCLDTMHLTCSIVVSKMSKSENLLKSNFTEWRETTGVRYLLWYEEAAITE